MLEDLNKWTPKCTVLYYTVYEPLTWGFNAILMKGTTQCHDRVVTVDDLVRKNLWQNAVTSGLVFLVVGENALLLEEIEVGFSVIAFSVCEIVRLTNKLFLR